MPQETTETILARIDERLKGIEASVSEIKPVCEHVTTLQTRVDAHEKQIESLFGKAWTVVLLVIGSIIAAVASLFTHAGGVKP